jgi:hypothetical protein
MRFLRPGIVGVSLFSLSQGSLNMQKASDFAFTPGYLPDVTFWPVFVGVSIFHILLFLIQVLNKQRFESRPKLRAVCRDSNAQ